MTRFSIESNITIRVTRDGVWWKWVAENENGLQATPDSCAWYKSSEAAIDSAEEWLAVRYDYVEKLP